MVREYWIVSICGKQRGGGSIDHLVLAGLNKLSKRWTWWPLLTLSMPVSYPYTVYHKKYAHGFVVLCFVVVMQSFIMNSHEVFIHIHQGCFAGTGAIVTLPQCQWSKPDGYGKISQCITTTKHSKAKTVCIFLGIYCIWHPTERIGAWTKWLAINKLQFDTHYLV